MNTTHDMRIEVAARAKRSSDTPISVFCACREAIAVVAVRKTFETEYSAHCPVKHSTDDTDFHYIFTLVEAQAFCHYYSFTVLLFFFPTYIFSSSSHIRSIVHSFVRSFASIESSPHLLESDGIRIIHFCFAVDASSLSILSCAHSHRIREFRDSIGKKGALYRWELVFGCCVRRACVYVCM